MTIWPRRLRMPAPRRRERARGLVRDATEAFRTGRIEAVAAALGEAHGTRIEVAVEPEVAGGDPHAVTWTLSPGRSAFVFDAELTRHVSFPILVERWIETLPLLLGFHRGAPDRAGSTVLNLGDYGSVPGLAFCDFRPEFTLVPDCRFIASRGYAEQKRLYGRQDVPWSARRGQALWRGQTSGWHDVGGREIGGWRDLPRVRLCELAREPAAWGLIDAALTGIVQVADEAAADEIRSSGLLGAPMPWAEFQRFKYQIDIDGNTSAWEGLFFKLCSGSCVLKVASSLGFAQWYYDRLVPWVNVVPVAADMTDLVETIDWLRRHDEVARQIGRNGAALAASMSHEAELVLAERGIGRAISGAAEPPSA